MLVLGTAIIFIFLAIEWKFASLPIMPCRKPQHYTSELFFRRY
jgi:hypothetical protein